jgi:hypothetical protein
MPSYIGLFEAFTLMGISMTDIRNSPEYDADEDRRKFLATCGKFAVVTPPAITALLSTSMHSTAVAQSGGGIRRSSGGIRRSAGEHRRD